MANLSLVEKEKLETFFFMPKWDMMNLNESKFFVFFRGMNIDISIQKYRGYSYYKDDTLAGRLCAFCEQENDDLVGKVLVELIKYVEYKLKEEDVRLYKKELKLIAECRIIAYKLLGKIPTKNTRRSKQEFLSDKFDEIQIAKLPIASNLQSIVEERFNEAQVCFENGAYLAAIVMAGSTLEAALIGVAEEYNEQFNNSASRPTSGGKTKGLDKWSLVDYINVGADIGLLSEDVEKYSHALRDFRNYIHPLRQTGSKFKPNQRTAAISLQVLKAALHDLMEHKPNESIF